MRTSQLLRPIRGDDAAASPSITARTAPRAVPYPPPEQQLLLLAARGFLNSRATQRLSRHCQEGMDWGLLCRTATAHGVMPSLYRNLSQECPDLVPAPILEQLRAAYYLNGLRNRQACGELLALLQELENRGIPAVCFKGPALAVWGYGSLAHRQFRDLDLLVHHRDFLAARDVLAARDYRPLYDASGEHEVDHLLSHYASEFISADRKFRVDLHRGFARRFSFLGPDPQELWKRLTPVELEGQGEVLTFSPEDSILHLALHGSKHGWSELKLICDLAQAVVAAPELDWNRLLDSARKSGTRKMLLVGLGLAHQLLELELTPEIQEEIRRVAGVAGLVQRFQGRLFDSEGTSATGRHHEPDWRVQLQDGWRSRVRYQWERCHYALTPTQKDWSLVRLPRYLTGLYYPIRLARLARRTVARGRKSQ